MKAERRGIDLGCTVSVGEREREKVVRNKMRQQQQQQRASTADTQPDEKSEREFVL